MSAAFSVTRNSFTSMKFNTKLGKNQGKAHHTRYLNGSASVKQSPGVAGLSCSTSTFPTWAAHLNPGIISKTNKVCGQSSREGDLHWEMSIGCRSVVQPLVEASHFISPLLLPEQVTLADNVFSSTTLCRREGWEGSFPQAGGHQAVYVTKCRRLIREPCTEEVGAYLAVIKCLSVPPDPTVCPSSACTQHQQLYTY